MLQVYITTASYVVVANNTISHGPRWGVHVRSNGNSLSTHVHVLYNRVTDVAQVREAMAQRITVGIGTATSPIASFASLFYVPCFSYFIRPRVTVVDLASLGQATLTVS